MQMKYDNHHDENQRADEGIFNPCPDSSVIRRTVEDIFSHALKTCVLRRVECKHGHHSYAGFQCSVIQIKPAVV
jgi:hypothetical protein